MNGEVHIITSLRDEITCLEKGYSTQPYKVANITEDKSQKLLRLMLMSSSPGILDYDDYKVKIEVSEGSSLELTTQSYQRLFFMQTGASQNFEARLSEGASFCFLPHPVVPHHMSEFVCRNKIFLSNHCSLIWGEVLTCGRKLNGEVFHFSKYQSITEILLNDALVLKENLLIQPSRINLYAIGQLEGYTHQASLIYLHETALIKGLIQRITNLLSMEKNIAFGITSAQINGLIVRILGNKAEQLHDCLQLIGAILR